MRKLVLSLALLGLAASPALAELANIEPISSLNYMDLFGVAQPRTTVVYSNVDTVTAAYSRLNPPAEEIGDELLMTAGGPLDSVKFSVFNSGSSGGGELLTADLTLKFYNWDSVGGTFVLAGTLAYDNVDFSGGQGAGFGLQAGYYTTYSVTGLYDENNPINLTDDILATLTISDLTGGANRVGQVLANPPAIGSSSDDFYRDGSWYWFSGNPVANFYWEIGVIPEPATLALLALGLLTLRRRR